MKINKEEAVRQIIAACTAAENVGLYPDPLKHIVFVGPPGSRKSLVVNAILEKNSQYEKAVAVTNRCPWPNESHDTHVFVNNPLALNTTVQVIDGTIYTIGVDENGASLDEMVRIIRKGKKFITFASISTALVLKDLFKDIEGQEIMIVYLDANKHTREQNLKGKFSEILKGISPQHKPAVMEKIQAYLHFGEDEMRLFKDIRKKEKENRENTSFSFYYLEHTSNFNPYSAAQFVLDNALTRYVTA